MESQYHRKFSVLVSLSPGWYVNSTKILSNGILGKKVHLISPKLKSNTTNPINPIGPHT